MRILWLKTELLHPVDKGGKIRTYHMLRELKREHHVTYLTLDDGAGGDESRQRAVEYCHDLVCVPHHVHAKFSMRFYIELLRNTLSPLPYFVRRYESALMQQAIADQISRQAPDVMVCDFLVSSINLPAIVPCTTVLFQHNVEAVIWRRYYEAHGSLAMRKYFYREWRRTRVFERAACRRFDQVISVSPADQLILEHEYGLCGVKSVPTGVDLQYFCPRDFQWQEPHNLVFTGSMDWIPNDDGICFFVKHVLAKVKEAVPDVTLTVVGRNPSQRLLTLGKQDPSIIVTGRVDDVRPYLERGSAYIVPLRMGSGTRLKIYEAMAMGKPIISTSLGAEGLPVIGGSHLLLADTPEAFAAGVKRVLTDALFARELGSRARRFVQEYFGWDRVAAGFAEICGQAILARKSRLSRGEESECCWQKELEGDPRNAFS
jgi:polysaccharide biosynthesis protein PslH